MTYSEIALISTILIVAIISIIFIARALKKVSLLRLEFEQSEQKNMQLSSDIDNMNHQINAFKEAYLEYAIQSRFELESQRREDAENRLKEILAMNGTNRDITPIVINTFDDGKDTSEQDKVIEELSSFASEEDEEDKIQQLIEEYQIKFKQEWEQELLKKYPDLMKKHYVRKAFAERVLALDASQKENYSSLKNLVMQYNVSRNRITKTYDTFYSGSKVIVKIGVTRKSIKLYLALNPNEYPVNKFPHKDVSETKKHAKTPYVMKIKSPLSLRRAEKLLKDLFANNEITKKDEYKAKDYVRSIQVLYYNQKNKN